MKKIHLLLPLIVLVFSGCKKKSSEDAFVLQFSKIRNSYLNNRVEILGRMDQKLIALNQASSSFYQVNNQSNFDGVVSKFNEAREAYVLTQPYLYGNFSLILPGAMSLDRLDGFPINPLYIDYYGGNATAGIINDATNYPFISQTNLPAWNYPTTGNYSCGYHVVEFLLFGEDISASGPGNRPLSDFTNMRRRSYLLSAIAQLYTDFNESKNQTVFKQEMLQQSPKESFNFIMDGLLAFIQTDFNQKGIANALNDQNDSREICRFSDKTMNELRLKVSAIRLFLDGASLYSSSPEYGLGKFIAEEDSDLHQTIQSELDQIETILSGIPVAFDQAILNPSYLIKLNQVSALLTTLHSQLAGFKSRVSGN